MTDVSQMYTYVLTCDRMQDRAALSAVIKLKEKLLNVLKDPVFGADQVALVERELVAAEIALVLSKISDPGYSLGQTARLFERLAELRKIVPAPKDDVKLRLERLKSIADTMPYIDHNVNLADLDVILRY